MATHVWPELWASLRGIRRRPVHHLVALAILTVGLAACVAVFTYFNSFYQPFPGADADGLVSIYVQEEEEPYQFVSYLDFLDYRDSVTTFEGLAAVVAYYAASVRLETRTEVAYLEAVTDHYFSVLGLETVLGRGIQPGDDRPGADPVAVISHGWWQTLFDASPDVMGQTIFLNFRPFTIVGVAAPEFRGSTSDVRPNVWIPIAPFRDRYTNWSTYAEDRNLGLVRVLGRLAPEVDEDRALAELQQLAAGLDETHPGRPEPRRLRLEPATWIAPQNRLNEMPTVHLMMAAAGGLLLLTCANVASLLLTLAAGRRHELALRAAVGATPGRILRLVLSENFLLGLLAGGLALALAGPLAARLGSYFARPSVWSADIPREVGIDGTVVLFTLVISVATGLLAGLLPALKASSRNLLSSLKTDVQLAADPPRRVGRLRIPGLQDLLVVFQVALSIVLLVVAGLVVKTLDVVRGLDPGFAHERLVASYISTSSTGVQAEDRMRFFKDLIERLEAEPWVDAATIAANAPLSGQPTVALRLEGQSDPSQLAYTRVVPGFFETLEIEVVEGRELEWTDLEDTPLVAVVNEALADSRFPGRSSVGRRIWWPAESPEDEREFEIVGVVRNARPADLTGETPPIVYFPYSQIGYSPGTSLLVSTTVDPAASIPMLYRWLLDLEPHMAIVNAVPYTEVVHGLLYAQRMNAEMFTVLALLGLTLAAAGIFSVVNLAVARRNREIGIRMALGARRGSIARFVLLRTLTPVALGVGLGLVASYPATRLVRALLYGVEPGDPSAVAMGATVMLAAALAAAFAPTRRATTLNPATTLR